MQYLAILGRQPEISLAELRAQFGAAEFVLSGARHGQTVNNPKIAVFSSEKRPDLSRFGGSLKFGELLEVSPIDFLSNLPDGKITLGVSDYSARSSARSAANEALRLKRILKKAGKSVRILPNSAGPAISTAAAHHEKLGKKPLHIELMKLERKWYRSIGTQNITAYAKRDQARPYRDARVGMLPPKLAQILINLCGPLAPGARILDPFCGTGVVLQEALLMGYLAYGTDLSERMVDYSQKNLEWLSNWTSLAHASATPAVAESPRPSSIVVSAGRQSKPYYLAVGDASDYTWQQPIDAVACEGYLGPPMSTIPSSIKVKSVKTDLRSLYYHTLKNLSRQLDSGTPVVMAIPAWLRPDSTYSRLNLLDTADELGYNVKKDFGSDLLYARVGQIVAREILILRKK